MAITIKERAFLVACVGLSGLAFYATGEVGWDEVGDSAKHVIPFVSGFVLGSLSYRWEHKAEHRAADPGAVTSGRTE